MRICTLLIFPPGAVADTKAGRSAAVPAKLVKEGTTLLLVTLLTPLVPADWSMIKVAELNNSTFWACSQLPAVSCALTNAANLWPSRAAQLIPPGTVKVQLKRLLLPEVPAPLTAAVPYRFCS